MRLLIVRALAPALLALLAGCPAAPHAHTTLSPAGPSVPNGIAFRDIARASGVIYKWPEQPKPMRNVEAFGRGCAFFDYDNDGWQDILLVDKGLCALFHNLRNGQFANVTVKTGISAVEGGWTGVGVGDYDGDGRLDLILTGFHRLALLHNEGGVSFKDVTISVGLNPHNHEHWGSSASFMDLNGDGRLHLLILNYVPFGPNAKQYCELHPGIKSGCPPSEYEPEYCELWENLGNGRFRDITKSSGFDKTHGKGLVMAYTDVDGDGKIDVYIGNDGTPADLMMNQGHLKFKNEGLARGIAMDVLAGHALAAMGADFADYDHDGRLDFAVSNFSDAPDAVFHALPNGMFEHAAERLGISGATLKPLGFGTKWIDVDNDGWPDLWIINGHVYDNVEQIDPLNTYRQPMLLFHNERTENGIFLRDLVPALGGALAKPIVGRGSATADIDNDGRIDMLAVDYEGSPVLLHNITRNDNHWITLELRGKAPNWFAYGAYVTAHVGSAVFVQTLSPASSYLSSSDPRIHFGLGKAAKIDSLDVRWPDGKKQRFEEIATNQFVTITEGQSKPTAGLH